MNKWEMSPPRGVEILENVSLGALTTMRVGGAAEYFVKVSSQQELAALIEWARAVALPYLILGGGSNILVADKGVRGLVIHNRCRDVKVLEPDPADRLDSKTRTLFLAESGAALAGAARTTIRYGLAGLEWAVSVPGTVGGAVVNNAGAHGGEVKDSLVKATVICQSGKERELPVESLDYQYRSSILKTKNYPLRASFDSVVLSATFALQRASVQQLNDRAHAYLTHRRRTQPVEPSLGSLFMNPPDDYAGRLIELAGLKGAAVGEIVVSKQHANFVTNPGGVGHGSAEDVLKLIQNIQQTVLTRCGVNLIPEVQLVGEWDI